MAFDEIKFTTVNVSFLFQASSSDANNFQMFFFRRFESWMRLIMNAGHSIEHKNTSFPIIDFNCLAYAYPLISAL